jgi:hypothetical protein
MSGIGYPQKPNRRLVGDAPRLPVRDLPKIGGRVTLEWTGVANASLTRPSPSAVVISMAGVEVEVVLKQSPMPTVKFRQRGFRMRFACPRCDASRDALHWFGGEWGCRGCFDLSYPCRHRQRYCPAIARRARLRRKLIRARPGSLKARMLREMIVRETRAMLAHLERVNGDLTKRRRRRAGHGRANSE